MGEVYTKFLCLVFATMAEILVQFCLPVMAARKETQVRSTEDISYTGGVTLTDHEQFTRNHMRMHHLLLLI